jgi:hypothetical protein
MEVHKRIIQKIFVSNIINNFLKTSILTWVCNFVCPRYVKETITLNDQAGNAIQNFSYFLNVHLTPKISKITFSF